MQKRSSFERVVTIGGVLLVVFLGAYAVFAQDLLKKDANPQKTERVMLRVGVASAGGEFSSLVVVADAEGYFAEEGLEVILFKEASGVSALKNLESRNLDIVTASDFAFVNNSFVDDTTKIIATIDTALAVDVVARRDAGISSPADLRGKKIGVVPETAADFVLAGFLVMNNLSREDITIADIEYAEAENKIVSGSVDAVIINNPFAYNIANTLGANGVSFPAQYGHRLLFNAISSDFFIESHQREVEKFLRALVRAEEFIKNNPEQAKQSVRESFSFTQEYVDKLWENHVFEVRLDQATLSILEAQARWVLLRREDEETLIPNYFGRMYLDGLSAVAPDAMTIIR